MSFIYFTTTEISEITEKRKGFKSDQRLRKNVAQHSDHALHLILF